MNLPSKLDLLCAAVKRRGYDHVIWRPSKLHGGWWASVGQGRRRMKAWGRTGASAVEGLLLLLERW